MTYYIAATLPEGPVKEEVIRTMRKFKVVFEGSTNPTRVKNFIDRQAFALASVKYPENPPGKPTKPIRPVHRVVDEGCPSTSGTSSTSREVVQTTAPVEQFNEVGQSPMMAAGSSKNVINDEMKFDDDDDDPLQHILNVCNKRAGQIEMEKNLDEVFREHDRNGRAEKGGVPPEVKQEEPDLSDVVEGEDVKPPIFTNEATNHSGVEDVQQPPPFVKEEEPEVEDDVMDVFPEEELLDSLRTPSPLPRQLLFSRMQPSKKTIFVCSTCNKSYTSFGFFKRHLLSHESSKYLIRSPHQATWRRHDDAPTTSSEALYVECGLCEDRFCSMWEMLQHQKHCHPPLLLPWPRSSNRPSSGLEPVNPQPVKKPRQEMPKLLKKTPSRQECWVCPLIFPAKELMEHMFTHPGTFRCDLCYETFALERILILHKEFHRRRNVTLGLAL